VLARTAQKRSGPTYRVGGLTTCDGRPAQGLSGMRPHQVIRLFAGEKMLSSKKFRERVSCNTFRRLR